MTGAQADSRSVGVPWDGSLADGMRLEASGDHFFTWDPVRKRSPNREWRRYGNERLLRTLSRVLADYGVAHPGAPRVGIGDLSRRHGGDFGPRFGGIGHASHQNGLDVDVYYPRRDRRELPPRVARQIDRALAQDLAVRFVAAGAAKVFVGPATRLKGPPAIVEVLPAYHDNHMHVRLPGDGFRSEVIGQSTRGQEIRAFTIGAERRPRILVVGCIHGNECAGSVVATRLLHTARPRRGSLWIVPDLNPDGHAAKRRTNSRGVDLNRNFPPAASASERETQVAMGLIRRLRPDITVWFHQPQTLVRAWGPSVAIGRRYARLAGMRFRRLPWPPGAATAWQNRSGMKAFVVELRPGELGIREAGRYAEAVRRLLDRAGQ